MVYYHDYFRSGKWEYIRANGSRQKRDYSKFLKRTYYIELVYRVFTNSFLPTDVRTADKCQKPWHTRNIKDRVHTNRSSQSNFDSLIMIFHDKNLDGLLTLKLSIALLSFILIAERKLRKRLDYINRYTLK